MAELKPCPHCGCKAYTRTIHSKTTCSMIVMKNALDLINRKNETVKYQAKQIVDLKIKVKEQRAEIEKLKEENKELDKENDSFVKLLDKKCNECVEINNEQAVKRFAKFLIDEAKNGVMHTIDVPELVERWRITSENQKGC